MPTKLAKHYHFGFQNDWDIFSDKVEGDDDLLQEMTLAILVADTKPKERVDFPHYDGFFVHQEPDILHEWYDKLDEMLNLKSSQHEDSDVYEPAGFPGRIELAIEGSTHVFNTDDIYFRARIHKDRRRKKRLSLSEMRAPAPKDATEGRANRIGEPVLYLATDYKTALCEVRSWRGMAVAVARMRRKRDIHVLDLVDLHYPQSPFETEYLSYDLQVIGLLKSFGSALSHPLLPGEGKRLYRSSQKLCDYVRQPGVEAILYPSAMGAGNNLVVFNPDDFDPVSIEYYRIGTPDFFPEIIHETEDIYAEWPYAIYDFAEQNSNDA